FYGIINVNVFTRLTCKLLSYKERLTEEALNSSCAGYRSFIFIRQFIHPQNSNNILQVFILLQNSNNLLGRIIMILANNVRIKNSGRRIQRINGGINTNLGECPAQGSGRIDRKSGVEAGR